MCRELGGQTSEQLRPGSDCGSSLQGGDRRHRVTDPEGQAEGGTEGPARQPDAGQLHREWAPGVSESKTLPFPSWLSEP